MRASLPTLLVCALLLCTARPAQAQNIFCLTAADCDDSNACTTDSFIAFVCVNTGGNCDDGNSCTTDTCNPAVVTVDEVLLAINQALTGCPATG